MQQAALRKRGHTPLPERPGGCFAQRGLTPFEPLTSACCVREPFMLISEICSPRAPAMFTKRWSIPRLTVIIVGTVLVCVCLAYRANLQLPGQSTSLPREGARLPWSELVYELEYSGSGAADLGALFGQASRSDLNAFHQTIKGRLGVKVCSVAADKSVVVFTLSPSTVSLQSGFSEISNHSLMADLSLPIVATVNDKGRILSVCFDQLASPQAQHLIRTILAATQIVLPESGSTATAWLTVEDDPNGEFDASYTVRDDKVVRKTKLHYAEPLPDSVDDIVFTPTCIPDGESLAQFDARGCMTALSVAEQQTLWLNGKCLGTTQLGLELNLVQTNTVNIEKMKDMTAKLNLDAAMSRGVRLSVRSTAAETNLILQRQSLGNSTVRDIVTKLVELDEGTANQADKTSLFLKCKALAMIQPESCSQLGGLLTSSAAGAAKMQIIVNALAAAGHDEAQLALGSAIKARSEDWPALAVLIPALATAQAHHWDAGDNGAAGIWQRR